MCVAPQPNCGPSCRIADLYFLSALIAAQVKIADLFGQIAELRQKGVALAPLAWPPEKKKVYFCYKTKATNIMSAQLCRRDGNWPQPASPLSTHAIFVWNPLFFKKSQSSKKGLPKNGPLLNPSKPVKFRLARNSHIVSRGRSERQPRSLADIVDKSAFDSGAHAKFTTTSVRVHGGARSAMSHRLSLW